MESLKAKHSATAAPFYVSFNIILSYTVFQVEDDKKEKTTISDVCLRIAEPDSAVNGKQFLPQFDCLMLSPANLWQNQRQVSC